MKRQKIAAGNWKMNKSFNEGRALAKTIAEGIKREDVLVILATPFIHLRMVSTIIKKIPNVAIAAQNCHQEFSGAYTGETSVEMVKSVGAKYVIVGHSERREFFNETDELLAKKVDAVLYHGLTPIFCCGEPLAIRQAGTHVAHVKKQLENSLFHLAPEQFSKLVIAYEPIWAIGTGVTATPLQAQEMHKAIRQLLDDKYGKIRAQGMNILYGGSVSASNAKDIFSQPDVDGGLVGGASLKPNDFLQIIHSF